MATASRFERRRIVSEELWRSVVWAGMALFGWSIIITSSPQLDANAVTVVGLPLLTWALLTGTMIGLRVWTGREL